MTSAFPGRRAGGHDPTRRAKIRCIGLALAQTAAAACGQDDAEARWIQAEVAGLVLGVGMLNDIPTAQVYHIPYDDMTVC